MVELLTDCIYIQHILCFDIFTYKRKIPPHHLSYRRFSKVFIPLLREYIHLKPAQNVMQFYEAPSRPILMEF